MLWLAPFAAFSLFALNEIANPRRALMGKILWRGDRKGVALTFDDGPHPSFTPRILDTLDRFHARGNFFVIGSRLKEHGDLVAAASRKGHLIGNHSFFHFRGMSFLGAEKLREEIVQCQEEIERWAGYRPRFYRQPAGFRNPRIFG
ncbi:MAG TPA: polysaccharide deacetylase family protein, partial [Thermodesulfobacteriota bacterium]|nr:polysaccharide deacetylase family protein [Thermodesulfobacteriota bacterium]